MTGRRGTLNLGSSRTRTTLVWVAVVIVVLVIVDVALVSLALGRTAPSAEVPGRSVPSFVSSASASASATPTPSPSASVEAVSTGRFLSAVNGEEAFRATRGTCGGTAPTLEHTVDAGATWRPVTLAADVSSLLSIRASTAGLMILAGIGDDCAPTVRSSTDGGVTWAAAAAGEAGAGVSPAGVVLPTGVIDPPCSDPIEAFQGKQTSVVICAGQLEWRYGTSEWVDVPLGGVRSMADAGNHYSLARIGTSTCAGVQIESMPAVGVTSATTTTRVGCKMDAATDGPISIARAGENVWLWAGDTVAVSRDGGASW